MEKITIEIEGTSPLLMHNGLLTDPLSETSRQLSSAIKAAKKAKTTTVWEAAYRIEFLGGLYLDDKHEPCLPAEVLEAMIVEGAKKSKQGKEVKAGVIVDGNFPLKYKGPRDADALWKAGFRKTCSAKVGQNRIMRTRPMFPSWGCTFDVHFNPSIVDRKDLIAFIEKAGAEVGIGDWRPRYGRFEVR